MDITNQPKPAQTQFTDRLADVPPDMVAPVTEPGQPDFLGYILVVCGVAALTLLMAIIGGWPLVLVTAIVAVLGLVHYWTWGRGLVRKVSAEQVEHFRRQLEADRQNASEAERPRHY
jgi:hypothetical protein